MFIKHINKDKVRRNVSNSFEVKLLAIKSIRFYLCNMGFGSSIYRTILNIIYKLNRSCFFSRVNNLCVLTGRQNGVYKLVRISRIELRDSKHNIYGLRKSS
jgi:ribosomal protein S14